MTYYFILNGREDKVLMRENVINQLSTIENAPEWDTYLTKSAFDATGFVREHCLAHPSDEVCYVACGGDGTICEVASGIMAAKAVCASLAGKSMAILSLGTGNDFVKYYPGRDFKSVKALFAATPTTIDIMKVNDRYSINVTNFGFDSVVGEVGGSLAAKGWKNPYRYGIVAAILTGRFNRISVTADGERLPGRRMLLATLANNHYVGGEFFCAPRAKNDDGLIDVCYIKSMSLMKFLKILPVYTAGRHFEDKRFENKIVYRQSKHVVVESQKTISLCLDGEMYQGTRFDVKMIPGAITLLIP